MRCQKVSRQEANVLLKKNNYILNSEAEKILRDLRKKLGYLPTPTQMKIAIKNFKNAKNKK